MFCHTRLGFDRVIDNSVVSIVRSEANRRSSQDARRKTSGHVRRHHRPAADADHARPGRELRVRPRGRPRARGRARHRGRRARQRHRRAASARRAPRRHRGARPARAHLQAGAPRGVPQAAGQRAAGARAHGAAHQVVRAGAARVDPELPAEDRRRLRRPGRLGHERRGLLRPRRTRKCCVDGALPICCLDAVVSNALPFCVYIYDSTRCRRRCS